MSGLIRNVLITGATSGIGKGISEYLIQKGGYCVYGIGRDGDKISDLTAESNFKFLSCDLANNKSIESLFLDGLSEVKFSAFVHCAGFEETLPISLYTGERIFDIFNVNFFSAVEMLRYLSKKKHSIDGASYVLLSSVMGELGQSGKVGYCASKAALLGLTRSLSLELSKRRIRVNAVSPGIVNTPLTEKLFSQVDTSNIDRIKAMHPLGIGEVSDVVGLIHFLLSDSAKWITGQNIKIDGGYSVQ